jgi:hypothetical protein
MGLFLSIRSAPGTSLFFSSTQWVEDVEIEEEVEMVVEEDAADAEVADSQNLDPNTPNADTAPSPAAGAAIVDPDAPPAGKR